MGAIVPRRRSRWRSLRWRLTLLYVGILAVILTGLGGVLLVTVNRLLADSSYTTFANAARAAAATRNSAFLNEVAKRDANNQCTVTFADAFQTLLSDPLTQVPAGFHTVALIDRATGVVLAPTAIAGTTPPELDLGQLGTLRRRAATSNAVAAWSNAVTQNVAVPYHTVVDGKPGAVILIAYDYRIVTSCISKTTQLFPAVLLISRDFVTTQQTIDHFKLLLGVSVGLLFVLGLAVGIPLTGISLGPLSRVTTTARRLAAGDLHQRVGLGNRHDEVGELAQTFDEMAQAVEGLFARQRQSEERMRQFINDASHELRTPITAISGCLEVLARNGYDDPPEMDRLIAAARRESARMERLINDLLLLAKFDTGRTPELVWTDLGQLVREAAEQVRLIAGDRRVTSTIAPTPNLALLDGDRIKQVLLILLDNAVKYGGQDASGWVAITVATMGTAVTISVRDNGAGIAAADLPHIFDRFYRATARKRAVSGSGLGLAIARAIVAAHGGSIAVTSAVDQGTCFTVVLPIEGPPNAASVEHPTRPLARISADAARDLFALP